MQLKIYDNQLIISLNICHIFFLNLEFLTYI